MMDAVAPMLVMFPWNLWFGALVILFGACIGSFLNVCIYRIPRDESVVHPGSHCPHCNQAIPWHLNIPVLSYLVLRGRCRFCAGAISPRYMLVEALVAVLFWIVWIKFAFSGTQPLFGLTPLTAAGLVPAYWLFVAGLVLGTFVDFEHLIIPDRVTLGGIVVGLIASALLPALHGQVTLLGGLLQSAIGLAVGWGLLWGVSALGRLIFRKDAMGFGDVKLMGAIGACLGWRAVLFTIFVSSFAGSLAGIGMILARKKQLQSRIPYGPYIALAALLWMFWGENWWQAYLTLLTPSVPPGL
jgi:leader peptidase (prepilin peptidase)/N-methyltransferase